MDRGSNTHSARMDDALKGETEGMMRSGHDTHAEEWKSAEPSGEDQPDVDRMPDGTLSGGTPPGLSGDDVEGRSELARFLPRAAFPGVGEMLLEAARQNEAPDVILEQLRALPAGREYTNVAEVWQALGGGMEDQRV